MHANHKEKFSYLNLHTEFSVSGYDNIYFGTRSCFNECVYRHRKDRERVLKEGEIVSNKYTVRVVFSDLPNEDNCCLLSQDELAEWIGDMKRFAEFEFKFRPDDNLPEGEAILVDLEFKKRPFAEHFLVLEMIKHSYEHMFNFSVYQAVKLRKIINPDELLINLHNLIFCCNFEFGDSSCGDHTIVTSANYYFNEYSTNGRSYRIAVMRTADEIKKMLPLTQTLYSMFDPAVVELSDLNSRTNARNAHYCDNGCSVETCDYMTKACLEQLKKFEYFVNSDHRCEVENFKSYFNPELCKKRLDVYLNTYERVKRDERKAD